MLCSCCNLVIECLEAGGVAGFILIPFSQRKGGSHKEELCVCLCLGARQDFLSCSIFRTPGVARHRKALTAENFGPPHFLRRSARSCEHSVLKSTTRSKHALGRKQMANSVRLPRKAPGLVSRYTLSCLRHAGTAGTSTGGVWPNICVVASQVKSRSVLVGFGSIPTAERR